MEHIATESEYEITKYLDFIVPLKQVGLITRSVLEAITQYYKPKRIIVVSSIVERPILFALLPFWDVGIVEFVDEETFFIRNYNLNISCIKEQYDGDRSGDQREVGWWIQQLIKLGAASQILNISTHYVVWDGDLVPTRRWRLCEKSSEGVVKFFTAILQGEPRSEFNTKQYSLSMRTLTGLTPLNPVSGGTFVAHHMVFNKFRMLEMLDLIGKTTFSEHIPWPILIMSQSRKYYRFSEYKTYASFMMQMYPEDFHYHSYVDFGVGGLRFRNANAVLFAMVDSCQLLNGGLSFKQVCEFVHNNWTILPKENNNCDIFPAYIQLDHVYGFETPKQHTIQTTDQFNCSPRMQSPDESRRKCNPSLAMLCVGFNVQEVKYSPIAKS